MNRKKIVLTVDGEKFDSWDKSGESIGYIIDACDCNIESINDEIKNLEKVFDDGEKCDNCGQTEYHTGEYPCPTCRRPTLHDEEE